MVGPAADGDVTEAVRPEGYAVGRVHGHVAAGQAGDERRNDAVLDHGHLGLAPLVQVNHPAGDVEPFRARLEGQPGGSQEAVHVQLGVARLVQGEDFAGHRADVEQPVGAKGQHVGLPLDAAVDRGREALRQLDALLPGGEVLVAGEPVAAVAGGVGGLLHLAQRFGRCVAVYLDYRRLESNHAPFGRRRGRGRAGRRRRRRGRRRGCRRRHGGRNLHRRLDYLRDEIVARRHLHHRQLGCCPATGGQQQSEQQDAGDQRPRGKWGQAPGQRCFVVVLHFSTKRVTGPSLWISTSMCAPKTPVATVNPARRSCSTKKSTSGSACSGAAASLKDGRRPLRASP